MVLSSVLFKNVSPNPNARATPMVIKKANKQGHTLSVLNEINDDYKLNFYL